MPSIGQSLGSLFVRLGLKSDDLDKGAEKSKRSLKDVRDSMNEVVKTGAKVAVSVGGVGAALVTLVYKAGESAREIRNLAQVANTTTREFQRNAAAARAVGIEGEKLADIYKDMSDRVGDFLQTGAGPMADFFENIAPQVGVTADQFARLSGPEALELFVSSLEKANLSQNEMTFYMEAIASDSTRLLPLLRNNAKAMRDLGDAAEGAGEVLSEMDLQELEDARRRIDDLKASLGSQFTKLIAENAENIVDLAEGLGEVAAKAIEATSQMLKFFGVMKEDQALELSKDLLDVQNQITALERGAALRRREGDPERIRAEERLVSLKEEEARISARLLDLEKEWHAAEVQRRDEAARGSEDRTRTIASGRGGRVAVKASGGGGDFLGEEAARRGAIADDAKSRLDILRDSLKTEAELEQDWYDERLETLKDNLELRLVTKEEFDLLEQDLESAHQERLNAITLAGLSERERFEAASLKNRVSMVSSELARMTAGVSSHNKQLFEINKAAGIANAVIATYEGVTKALAAYPPPLSFAMAGAQAAAGFAQVNAIRNQKFGQTGGVAPALAGSTAAPPVSPVGEGGQPGQVIAIEGLSPASLFSGKAVRELLEQVNEAVADGGRVVFTE